MHVAKLKQVSVDHPPSVCNVKTLAAAVLWRLTEYTRYNLSNRINVRKKCGRETDKRRDNTDGHEPDA